MDNEMEKEERTLDEILGRIDRADRIIKDERMREMDKVKEYRDLKKMKEDLIFFLTQRIIYEEEDGVELPTLKYMSHVDTEELLNIVHYVGE